MLFDRKILKEQSYPIPIICVGNIAVGGTGKTPHIEYIIRQLKKHYRLAVVSRGYKRKSKGLIIADASSTALEIGDEPWQIKNKYPEVSVLVDGNRRRAIDYLLKLPKEEQPEVILLDDGFQHRYVRPSFSILLSDYSKPMDEDSLLPLGSLRESSNGRYRADCIIVSKCPREMRPIDTRIIQRRLALYPHQKLFFSAINYDTIRPLRALEDPRWEDLVALSAPPVLIVAGVAKPEPMIEEIRKHFEVRDSYSFPDHHLFREADLAMIEERLDSLGGEAIIICSEKDAARFLALKDRLTPKLLEKIYYLPIEVEILNNKGEFDRLINLSARALPKSLQY